MSNISDLESLYKAFRPDDSFGKNYEIGGVDYLFTLNPVDHELIISSGDDGEEVISCYGVAPGRLKPKYTTPHKISGPRSLFSWIQTEYGSEILLSHQEMEDSVSEMERRLLAKEKELNEAYALTAEQKVLLENFDKELEERFAEREAFFVAEKEDFEAQILQKDKMISNFVSDQKALESSMKHLKDSFKEDLESMREENVRLTKSLMSFHEATKTTVLLGPERGKSPAFKAESIASPAPERKNVAFGVPDMIATCSGPGDIVYHSPHPNSCESDTGALEPSTEENSTVDKKKAKKKKKKKDKDDKDKDKEPVFTSFKKL